MAKSSKATRKKDPVGEKFAARLRSVAEKNGVVDIDSLVRLSPRIKYAAAESWWHGWRTPGAANIIDLCRALKVDPLTFIKGLGLDMKKVAGVEAICKSEG